MTDLLEHLYSRGYRRLVHVAGPRDIHDARIRRRSFQRFVRTHKDIWGETLQGGLTVDQGHSAIAKYLKGSTSKADALLCFNDSTAYGALQALNNAGLRIPEDLAVTGFDDDAASEILGLTTLHMPMRELGREAARLLFDRLEHAGPEYKPCHSLLELILRVRTSS